MDQWLMILIITLSLTMLLVTPFFLLHLRYIQKKNSQLVDLKNKLKSLQNQLHKNRRRAVRINIPLEYCKFQFKAIDDPALMSILNRVGSGHIHDISTKGLRIVCEYDLPIQRPIFLEIHFQLQNVSFKLNGKIIRKEAHVDSNQVIYGIEYSEMSSNKEIQLAQLINKIQLEKCMSTA